VPNKQARLKKHDDPLTDYDGRKVDKLLIIQCYWEEERELLVTFMVCWKSLTHNTNEVSSQHNMLQAILQDNCYFSYLSIYFAANFIRSSFCCYCFYRCSKARSWNTLSQHHVNKQHDGTTRPPRQWLGALWKWLAARQDNWWGWPM